MAEISNNISRAAELLTLGELVAIPTETVYGLAANALNPDAVVKIFEVKNRPTFDPLIVHLYDASEISKYVTHIPDNAKTLMEAFMPGALTLLLPKNEVIPDIVNNGLKEVGLRVPSHPLTRELLKLTGFPIAAPSANPFSYISPTSSAHVNKQLGDKISFILEGGISDLGLESTIVGFNNNEVIVYRLGSITIEEIEKVVGKVTLKIQQNDNPETSGQLSTHYAPINKLLFQTEKENQRFIEFNPFLRIAVIAHNTFETQYKNVTVIHTSTQGNYMEAAKNLFDCMRRADTKKFDVILANKADDIGLGRAINDRLKRSSFKPKSNELDY